MSVSEINNSHEEVKKTRAQEASRERQIKAVEERISVEDNSLSVISMSS